MGSDNRKFRLKRRPKRKENQFTTKNKNTEVVADDGEIPGPSQPKVTTANASKLSGKLQKLAPAAADDDGKKPRGNRMIDMGLLSVVFEMLC